MSALLQYISTGLIAGDICIVIAQPRTLISLNKRLRFAGVDVGGLLFTDQYQTYDADDLLAEFMRNGRPDRYKLSQTVGRMLSEVLSMGKPVRVFGEMLAVLLEQQNMDGAIKLERFWNYLMGVYDFSLYCAYPDTIFHQRLAVPPAIDAVCAHHAKTYNHTI
jgi:hypothetical protein